MHVRPQVDPEALDTLKEEQEALAEALRDAEWRHARRCAAAKSAAWDPAAASRAARPTHKTGLWGLFGPRVDTLDWLAARLGETQGRLDAARRALLTGQRSADAPLRRAAFVGFMSAREATMACQVRPADASRFAAHLGAPPRALHSLLTLNPEP